MACKSKSLIHKLNNRQVNGAFSKKLKVRAGDLFDEIPEEQIFNLGQVFKDLGTHVFMGTTYCGKFLLTYSIKKIRPSGYGSYRLAYVLHIWSFSRAPHKSKKVAEVHLFSGFTSEITSHMNITIAQWPTVRDKLVVYGEILENCCHLYGEGDYHMSYTYLTITHLPSLESCPQCKEIAEIHEIKAGDPSVLPTRCLKHGATLDAKFHLAHPHPKLDVRINLKFPNRFVVNTGNFIHVLTMELHNSDVLTSPSSRTSQNSDENSKYIRNIDRDYKVTRDLNKFFPVFKFLHVEDPIKKKSICNFVEQAEQENVNIRKLETAQDGRNSENLKNIMAQADKIYAFEEFDDGCELKFKCLKWFRKRKLADKMYEFCSDDDEIDEMESLLKTLRHEYEHSTQPKTSRVSFGRFLKIRLNPLSNPSKTLEISRKMQNSPEVTTDETDDSSQTDTELFLKTDSICSKPDNCDISSIISDWESQDTASLSPKSDISNVSDFSTGSMPGTSSGIRFSLKNKKPRHSLKKYTSTSSDMNTQNKTCSLDSNTKKTVCVILKPHNRLHYPADDNKSQPRKTSEPHQNNLISGCCDQFERYYVEDEIESDTQVEGDEGDDKKVPIIVRNSYGYKTSKLKLISDSLEARNNEFCSIKTKTLDIEQFCYKAADLICEKENYNFRSCNDYEIEIANVCPLSGDVMAVVSIRMNALYGRLGPPLKKYAASDHAKFLADSRKQFDTCCILVWNVDTLVCRLEAYTPLRTLKPGLSVSEWDHRTFDMARMLRFPLGYFNVPCLLPRCVTHQVKTPGEDFQPQSMTELHDKDNLTGFRLDKRRGRYEETETDTEDEIDEALLF